MKLALFTLMSLAAAPAYALDVSLGGLVDAVVYLIIAAFIIGILLFLVRRAPFIPEEAKSIIVYVIYFFAALFVIFFLLGLAGHSPVNFR